MELRQLPRLGDPTCDASTEQRNRWIYEECWKGTPYKEIIRQLERNTHEWLPIASTNGVKAAAARYADQHSLTHPFKRKQGGLGKEADR